MGLSNKGLISLMGKEEVLARAYKELNDFLRSDKCERTRESAGLGAEIYFCKVNDDVSITEEVKPYSEPKGEFFSKYYVFNKGKFVSDSEKARKIIEESTGIDIIEAQPSNISEYVPLDEVVISFKNEEYHGIPEEFEGTSQLDIDKGLCTVKEEDY